VPRIHLLPDTLINQIAAGEVVERPASVVKELIENALDAGAGEVRIRLISGGCDLVEVTDDGCGMDGDDALLALQRHATSKISEAEDLDRLTTMGFRGEALPAIAAASHLTLETATMAGAGWQVTVDFGRAPERRAIVRPRGTRVAVADLFARLPARRKFLRSAATELRHAVAVTTALAFTRPQVAFFLEHGSRPLLALPRAEDVARRLPDLVGAARAREARPFRHDARGVRVEGFLLPPGAAREQIVVVNGRVVRDKLVSAALNRALRGPSGAPLAAVYLRLELAPDDLDVNVHPSKAEVRFRDSGTVFAAIAGALAMARPDLHGPVGVSRVVVVPPSEAVADPRYPSATRSRPRIAEAGLPFSQPHFAAPRGDVGPALLTPLGRYIGQYRATYLLLEDSAGLLLVDQHVAHERVLFERLLESGAPTQVQRLLLPEVVDLPPQLAVLAGEVAPDLERLGVEIEAASGAAVRILGTPASLPAVAAGPLLERLLGELRDGSLPGVTTRERIAASLSCQAAIKKNRPLAPAEAERLLADLATVREPHRCPHGRPILLRLEHAEIERRIGRR
jgi:DNA mismatch repair protein MutL